MLSESDPSSDSLPDIEGAMLHSSEEGSRDMDRIIVEWGLTGSVWQNICDLAHFGCNSSAGRNI
eukprot:14584891-Ditylum_brightwellii.AAC.1